MANKSSIVICSLNCYRNENSLSLYESVMTDLALLIFLYEQNKKIDQNGRNLCFFYYYNMCICLLNEKQEIEN